MALNTLPTKRFRLRDENIWDTTRDVVQQWQLPSRTPNELNLNRRGTIITDPGSHAAFADRQAVLDRFHLGFSWQPDDQTTKRWIPQGLTGNTDRADEEELDGRKWLLASWHNESDDAEKGMRISWVDVTSWRDPIRYRNVLLVEPVAAADDPSRHVSFKAIPAHADGVVWFRDYLYVADSRGFEAGAPGGLLVFDMTRPHRGEHLAGRSYRMVAG